MSKTVYFDADNPNTEYVVLTQIYNKQIGHRQFAQSYSTKEDMIKAVHNLPFAGVDRVYYGGKQFDWDTYYGRTA